MTTYLFPGVKLETVPATAIKNSAYVNQAITDATKTVVAGTLIAIPNGGLSVGSKYKARLAAAKTAGTAASTIAVALGAKGDTTDATLVTFSTGTATAVPDEGIFELEVTITAVDVAAGTANAEFRLTHGLEVTGWAVVPSVVLNSQVTAKDTSSDTSFLSVQVTTGAGAAMSIHLAEASLENVTTGNPA